MQKTFFKNFAVTSFSNILILVFALLNNVLITRWLGPEGRGVYAVVSTIVIFISLLLGDGLRRSNTIIVGKDSSTLKRLIIINFYYFLFLLIILSITFYFKSLILTFIPNISPNLLWIAFMISAFSIMWQAIQAIYLGLQKIVFFNVLMVGIILIMLIMNYLGIIIFEISLFGILQNMLIANLLIYIISLLGFLNYTTQEKVNSNYKLFRQFFLSSKSTFSAIANYFVLRSSIFFVNALLGKSEAGLFSVAFIFFDLIQKLPNVAGTLIFSKIVNEKEKSSFSNIAKVIRTVFVFNVLVSLIFLIFGQEIITFLFGEAFYLSNEILRYMVFGLMFSGPGSVIHSYFMGIGFPKRMLVQNMVVAIFALICNYLLIKVFGLNGAGLSYSLIFSFWSIYYIIMFIRISELGLLDVLVIQKGDIQEIKEYLYSILKR